MSISCAPSSRARGTELCEDLSCPPTGPQQFRSALRARISKLLVHSGNRSQDKSLSVLRDHWRKWFTAAKHNRLTCAMAASLCPLYLIDIG